MDPSTRLRGREVSSGRHPELCEAVSEGLSSTRVSVVQTEVVLED